MTAVMSEVISSTLHVTCCSHIHVSCPSSRFRTLADGTCQSWISPWEYPMRATPFVFSPFKIADTGCAGKRGCLRRIGGERAMLHRYISNSELQRGIHNIHVNQESRVTSTNATDLVVWSKCGAGARKLYAVEDRRRAFLQAQGAAAAPFNLAVAFSAPLSLRNQHRNDNPVVRV